MWSFHIMEYDSTLKRNEGASLVAQRLRVCLPMQGTRVRALVWEDPTCRRATKPVSHDYWACASGACAPQRERPLQWEARAPRWRVAPTRRNWRKPSHRNEDPTQPKTNKINLLKKKKEWSSDTCYNMNKPWKHHTKWKKPDTKGQHCMIILLWET